MWVKFAAIIDRVRVLPFLHTGTITRARCHNESMHHPASHLLTDLSILVESLAWLRGAAQRQQSQPWQQIKCGPSHEAVSVHLARFKRDWSTAIRQIVEACPSAAGECAALLRLDPLDSRNDVAIAAALSSLRVLSDPRTVRSMAREKERSAFGGSLRRLRVERGFSLRGLAHACEKAAQRLRFNSHTPEHYQLVRYEAGRLAPHPRTVRVIAAALGVTLCELERS
jgi:hypothetical protein